MDPLEASNHSLRAVLRSNSQGGRLGPLAPKPTSCQEVAHPKLTQVRTYADSNPLYSHKYLPVRHGQISSLWWVGQAKNFRTRCLKGRRA
jgi:hypothetical protein